MDSSQANVLEEALDRALEDQGLHPGFRAWIRQLVFDHKDDWRLCCGNHCDPCVQPMARAVDQVRERIQWQPESGGEGQGQAAT